MDKALERIRKKCEAAKKRLLLCSWHRKRKKTDDTYVQPVSSSRKIDV
jgi:hypothetical protein